MGQLIIPGKSQLEGNPKRLSPEQTPQNAQCPSAVCSPPSNYLARSTHLDRHDGYASDQRTDGQVDHGILWTVLGYDLDNHVGRKDAHGKEIKQET
jgi:hypothetical protein